MTLDEAYQLASRKCAMETCWHRPASGYIYCLCCLYGSCLRIYSEEQMKIEAALETIRKAKEGQGK